MLSPNHDFQIAAPRLRHFAEFRVQVGPAQEVGETARGLRRVIPIVGGQVQGEDWSARVLPGGADFQLLVSEQVAELDARYVIETDGGDLIYVSNQALRTGPAELMERLQRIRALLAEVREDLKAGEGEILAGADAEVPAAEAGATVPRRKAKPVVKIVPEDAAAQGAAEPGQPASKRLRKPRRKKEEPEHKELFAFYEQSLF